MRLIDADALLDDIIDRICNDCDKRKGIKDGKWRIIYSIGDAPCRACSVDDTKDDIDSAPTIDAVPVVRCKNCKWHDGIRCFRWNSVIVTGFDDFCSEGERKTDA